MNLEEKNHPEFQDEVYKRLALAKQFALNYLEYEGGDYNNFPKCRETGELIETKLQAIRNKTMDQKTYQSLRRKLSPDSLAKIFYHKVTGISWPKFSRTRLPADGYRKA